MIFFSSKKLEAKLAHNQLSDWEKAKYMVFLCLAEILFGGPVFLVRPQYGPRPPFPNSLAMLIGGIIMAVITYWWIKRIYLTNKEIDGKNFIERFTVLSFPVFMKFTVWLIPGTLIVLIIFGLVTRNNHEMRKYVPSVIHVVFIAVIFGLNWLINNSFKRFGALMRRAQEDS